MEINVYSIVHYFLYLTSNIKDVRYVRCKDVFL